MKELFENNDKLTRILLVLAGAALYLVLAAWSGLEQWLAPWLATRYTSLNIILMMAILVFTSCILFINLYSYSLFSEIRHLFFSIIALLLMVLYSIQLLGLFDSFILTSLEEDVRNRLSVLLVIVLLFLLLIKLLFIRRDMFLKLPFRHVPVLLLAITVFIFVMFFLVRPGTKFSDEWVIAVLVVLSASNLFGYLIKYVAVSDQHAQMVFSLGLIHLVTFIYPPFGQPPSGYVLFWIGLFRLIGLIYMLRGFYKQLFDSYVQQVEAMNRRKNDYTNKLESIIRERTRNLQDLNQQLQRDVDAAAKLQRSMMPAQSVRFRQVSFSTRSLPCEKMSGDFFDIYEIDEHRVGMYILDVAGHGLQAALMNIYIYHYIRSTSPLIKRFLGDKPHKNLEFLYEQFNRMNFPDEVHLVIVIAAYDMQTRRLTYSSGGMNTYPILFRKDGTSEKLDAAPGFPICRMGDFFTPIYVDCQVELQVGDRVFFCTDGVFDSRQPFHCTEEELSRIFFDSREDSLQVLSTRLAMRLKSDRPLVDDVTYFILQVEAPWKSA